MILHIVILVISGLLQLGIAAMALNVAINLRTRILPVIMSTAIIVLFVRSAISIYFVANQSNEYYHMYFLDVVLFVASFLMAFVLFKARPFVIKTYKRARADINIDQMPRDIIEASSDACAMISGSGSIMYTNKKMDKLLISSDKGELPEMIFQSDSFLGTYFTEQRISNIVKSILTVDTTLTDNSNHYDLHIVPINNIKGEVYSIYIQLSDITSQQFIKQAIKDRDSHFRGIVETSPLAILLHSEFKIDYINESAIRVLGGFTSDQFIGRDIYDIIPPESREDSGNDIFEMYNGIIKAPVVQDKLIRIDGVAIDAILYISSTSIHNRSSVQLIIQDITERVISEKELIESRKRYAQYMEHAPFGMFVYNEKGVLLEVNPMAEKISGLTKSELKGQKITDIIHRKEITNLIHFLFPKQGDIKSGNIARLININKQYIYVAMTCAMLSGNKYIAFCNDITQEMEANKLLSESRKNYQSMLDNIRFAILINDKDQNIIQCNNMACKVLGYSHEELLNLTINQVDTQFSIEKNTHYYWDKIGLNDRITFESLHKRKDGNEYPVEIHLVKFLMNSKEVMMSSAIDISDRKRAIEEIKKREQTLFSIFKAAPIGIALVNNSIIGWSNKALSDISGYSEDEIQGLPELSLFPGQSEYDYANMIITQQIKEDNVGSINTKIVKKNGKQIDVVYSSATNPGTGVDEDRVITIMDISQLITVQDELEVLNTTLEERVKERTSQLGDALEELNYEIEEKKRIEIYLKEVNAAKDKFFQIIAYDLKSPLTIMMTSADLMQKYINNDEKEKIQRHIGKLKQTTLLLDNLLNNLMTWSSLQSGRISFAPEYTTLCNIYKSIEPSIVKLASKKNITIQRSGNIDKTVFVDTSMIANVFRNLLHNSIKYSKNGSEIIMDCNISDSFVKVKIEDYGSGIRESDIYKLFKIDKHFTTIGGDGEQGTGLGLILCKEFIDKNGGIIDIRSEFGTGTTVTFTLPQSAEQLNQIDQEQ